MHLRYDVTPLQPSATGPQATGQADLWWHHDGERYDARMVVAAGGAPARTLTSTGRVTAQGLAPRRFSERLRHEEAAHFDPAGKRITFSGNQPAAAWLPGAQDRLSVMLQLAARLAARPADLAPGQSISITTATAREVAEWRFSVEALEELSLPGRDLRAWRLLRRPVGPFDFTLELWLAPELAYMPVRLRLTQPGGHGLDQRWRSADGP